MTERLDSHQAEPMPSTSPSLRARRPLLTGVLVLLAVTVLAVCAWPVRAAIVLDYFDVIVSPDEVLLEWATLNEFNISGFNIYCKEEAEPPTDYHVIGSVIAQGGPDVGYLYTFPVTDLEPGVAYCFRLEEITTDGTAPELFDRCGFGLNITPTPTLPVAPGAGVVGSTPVQTPVDLVPNGASQLEGTATPVTFDSSQGQPTATPISGSPLGNVDPNLNAITDVPANAASDPLNSPLETPTATTFVDPNATPTPVQEGGTGALSPDNAPPAADPALAQGLPTPLYIVLTATPTPPVAVADGGVLPTLTPLPTATPGSESLLAALTEVSAENILLATLCLVFLGGSGLGILGITSLGLYLRSRSDNRRAGPPSDRRYR